MVGVLIRMKLAMLRNSMTGGHAAEMALGAVLGVLTAAGTIVVAVNDAAISADVLAVVFAGWTLGWVLGPLFAGGERNDLRPEHLTRVPMSSRTMANGLFGMSLFGIGPAVTLLAFLALVVFAVRLGIGPTLVALVAVPATLATLVLLSRITIALVGETMRSRVGAALVAVPWAVIVACASNIGVLLVVLGQSEMLRGDWPAWLPITLRVLPSGWGVAAVEAAGRSDWLVAGGLLVALVALVLGLLALWSRLLHRRVTGALGTPAVRPKVSSRTLVGRLPSTRLGAVIGKELRTWPRDMLRTYFWFFALWFAITYSALPLLAGVTAYLPWAGVALVIIAAASSANLYSADGSALWLTLMNPGVERVDVRGRQLAWLLVTVPVALALTVIGILVDGQGWLWPWALGFLASSIGTGAGLLALLSVMVPIRMPDAHRRSANPATDSGNITGLVWIMIGASVAAALPVAGVVLLGTLRDDPLLRWSGVPLGLLIGGLALWLFGRLTYRRLETNGPELLEKLRGGNPNLRAKPGEPTVVLVEPPGANGMRVTIGLCLGAGWIPMASGVISLILLVGGDTSRTLWTFATRLPEPLPVPVSILLVGLSVLVYATGARTLLRLRRLRREPATTSAAAVAA
ncbi:hypothetical protein [Actinoalloteichus caeruleus]|uniref:hypothetical protein n=1 Tax=Actinoalloteichus cyanogriseus TaxID=2893586 RepID=UPI00068C67A5|nr:hypothetical protein [Actinoalloteichus caeruleus]